MPQEYGRTMISATVNFDIAASFSSISWNARISSFWFIRDRLTSQENRSMKFSTCNIVSWKQANRVAYDKRYANVNLTNHGNWLLTGISFSFFCFLIIPSSPIVVHHHLLSRSFTRSLALSFIHSFIHSFTCVSLFLSALLSLSLSPLPPLIILFLSLSIWRARVNESTLIIS